MSLSIDNLNCAYGAKAVLHNVSAAAIPAGQLTALIGPNAAGKSSLFKSLAGIVPATAASIKLGGRELSRLSQAQRFEQVCYMPQGFGSNAALTVFEMVLLARKQQLGRGFGGWQVSEADSAQVAAQLQRLDIEHLAGRYIGELSGGQQQLVSLCQALSRDAELLLLDEPSSALDLRRQLQVLQLLREHCRQRGCVCIVSIHDLSLAARFADHVLLLRDGQLVCSGATEEVMGSGELERTYGVDIELLRCARGHLLVSADLSS